MPMDLLPRLAPQVYYNYSNGVPTVILNCSYCGPGKILPIIPFELCWNPILRAILYFFGLVYAFCGIAIVSDIFMSSIEKITSKTKEAFVKVEIEGRTEYKVFEDKVWNDTIANLTLMALGSSAPEILLSCIEIVSSTFEAGQLGAGTIVGSAAFNLLIITAACFISPPRGETRKIKIWKVFIVTSVFSLFAYFWMLVALDYSSVNEVELWEALITLLMFPLLIFTAWWADHDFCLRGRKTRKSSNASADEENGPEADIGVYSEEDSLYKDGIVNQEALVSLYKHLREINPELTDEEITSLVATKLAKDKYHTRAWYHSGVTRGIMGGPHNAPILNEKLQEVYNILSNNLQLRTMPAARRDSDQNKAVVEFLMASFAVMENVGNVQVKLIRHGRMDNEVKVKVETFDGTAGAGTDYVPFKKEVTFAPNVTEVDVTVTIIDDNQWEPEEEFFLRATIMSNDHEAVLGKIPIMEIVILDDDKPGMVSFNQRGALVKQNCGSVELQVKRTQGCDGIVKVGYRTVDGTAISPDDYKENIGQLVFPHGEIMGTIRIPIVDTHNADKNVHFFVTIYDPTSGLQLGEITKVKVTISNEEMFTEAIEKMMLLAAEHVEALQAGHESYKDQFNEALSVNGGNLEDATCSHYILHIIMFFWKVFFAFIPPVKYWQGWACFISSLLCIGLLTAIVGDMAEQFGCLIGIPPTITAITFVALGTSVPDLFASISAASNEKYADNAIGNITGSNSVNVFLGLGLPWTMAAIYHKSMGSKFKVESGDLAFSVAIYSSLALVALFILFVRRIWVKAELGGSQLGKWSAATIFILFWGIYILLSCLASAGKLGV